MAAPKAERGSERLAVIVPTLNERAALPALLESIGWPAAALDPAVPDQLVVVDGGSTDGTPDVARDRGALVLTTRAGRGTQLAAGARAADADVLLFLHADCRLSPGALVRLRAAFRDPAVVVAGLAQRVDAAGWFYRSVERAANFRVRRGWVYGDSGLAVRRAAYERVGGFADVPLFEDLDLSRRLRKLGRARLVDDADIWVSARRWEAEGRIARTVKNWALTLAWMSGVSPEKLARHYAVRRPHDEVAA